MYKGLFNQVCDIWFNYCKWLLQPLQSKVHSQKFIQYIHDHAVTFNQNIFVFVFSSGYSYDNTFDILLKLHWPISENGKHLQSQV